MLDDQSGQKLRTVNHHCKRTLDTQEHKVLSLGLNVAFCPTKVPMDDIICRTEQVASLHKEKGQPLREEVSRCLHNFELLKHTFNKEEYNALKRLRCDAIKKC